ncbi:methyl-accepting chemotaxis protein [Spiribacter halobius]|uniref:Methyl-accepting chemotaxis protein n=1 Tax=Sediminicurvatus halobius TaxID=2182432 RepID=A0A2U2N0H8_9GAMM|nr:methyl-accepting chemotaxis protein [Spiribacter halobius]PWG62479.1 hypothetical protein DEM34_11885 [Spiribacter halobius]UEX78569.1 methyl-accepting chemotaxis protein [Spiribacter halobius]
MKLLQRQGMAVQVTAALLVAVVVIMGVLVVFASTFSQRSMLAEKEGEMRQQVRVLDTMLEFYYEVLESRANEYARVFAADFPGELTRDTSERVTIGDYRAPVMRHDGEVLNLDFSTVDAFARQTGGNATVFVRYEDDFLRVTTSLKKEDGSRAIGTLLGQSHPGYRQLMAGEPYIGRARLFGRDYMTRYDPVLDRRGEVIGILYVGVDYTAEFADLRQSIAGLTFGESGRAFAVDRTSAEAPVVLHAEEQRLGSALAEAGMGAGEDTVSRLRGDEGGVFRYAGAGSEWLMAHQPVDGWGWTIAARGALDDFQAAGARLGWLLAGAGVIAGVLLVAVGGLTLRRMLRPLDALGRQVRRVGEGDLTVDFRRLEDEGNRNELRRMEDSLAAMTADFRKLIGEVVGAAQQLASAAGQMLETTRQSAQGAERQQSEADQVGTAMNEMAQTVQEVARNAAEAAEAAKEADGRAGDGQQTVERTAEAIRRFAEQISGVAGTIREVEQGSERIGGVVDLINGISEQTNLLALNAAIEAARAGEQGRGFAVVAEEVRSLANRTQEATKEIQGTVESLQRLGREASERMTEGEATGRRTAEHAEEAGEALQAIAESVSHITRLNQQIATAAEEQSQVAEEINRSVVSIRDVSAETAEGAAQSRDAGDNVARLADDLRERVARFRT